MASGKSTYLERAMLDFVLSKVAFTPPASYYIALSTAVWSGLATGTVMTEATGGGYARVAVVNDSTQFPAAGQTTPATKSNGVDLVFPTATASWGTVMSVYLVDQAINGNVFYGGDLAASKLVSVGDIPKFLAGALVFGEL